MKETQGNELTSLANFVKLHENKILILNSRLTILNEAKERDITFNNFFGKKKIENLIINMDTISPLEKALIFYNHLVFKNVPKEYCDDIKVNKNYMKIVMHNNFTPRIIEHVTYSANFLNIPTNSFTQYILENLNNPNDIWKNEYYQRIKEEDRAFLTTLYSLTDTIIERDILKKCFNKRLSNMINIDHTLNNFESVLARLNQSIVKVVDNKGIMCIGVVNPSVNDFLKQVLLENEHEKENIQKSIVNYLQFKKCYTQSEIIHAIGKMFDDGSIISIEFDTTIHKYYFITSYVCNNEILNNIYQDSIYNYLSEAYGQIILNPNITPSLLKHNKILEILLQEDLQKYYNINQIFNNQLIENMLKRVKIEDLISAINIFDNVFTDEQFDEYFYIFEDALKKAIYNFAFDFSVSDYCENKNINELIDENNNIDNNRNKIYNTIADWVQEEVNSDIKYFVSDINNRILRDIEIPEIDDIDYSDEIDNIVNSYLEPDYSSYNDFKYETDNNFEKEIEYIFER